MSQGVTTGLFALGGVLVGGLIAVAGEWWNRRSRAAARKLVAMRLVYMELLTARVAVTFVLGRYDPEAPDDEEKEKGLDKAILWARRMIERGRISDAAWQEHRATLAEHLSHDEWMTVWMGYANLALLAATPLDQPVDLIGTAHTLDDAGEDVDKAMAVLGGKDSAKRRTASRNS